MNLETDEASADKISSRSLTLSSETLGVIAKLDVAEAEAGVVTPIDYKRGKRPHIAQGAYEPERVQVCLQGLLLEEHGYRVEEGVIYYAESRERVRVVFDDALRTAARTAVSDLRLTVSQGRLPPPLKDSPKCPGCALVTVCLPDEVRALTGSSLAPRSIAVPADEALPLVVQSQHARIGKDGETLKITDEEQGETRVRFIDISDVALFGNVSITTPALSALFEREIPVTFHSHGGWFRGIAHGVGHRNGEVRTAQYRMSFDEASCLRFARDLVAAKIMNQRTILRRNWREPPEERPAVLHRLRAARRSAGNAARSPELLGVEGDAAATYFRAFAGLLKQPDTEDDLAPFRFEARNRPALGTRAGRNQPLSGFRLPGHRTRRRLRREPRNTDRLEYDQLKRNGAVRGAASGRTGRNNKIPGAVGHNRMVDPDHAFAPHVQACEIQGRSGRRQEVFHRRRQREATAIAQRARQRHRLSPALGRRRRNGIR